MKLKKRILSLLLCGAMLFSLCSQSVLAEENGQAGGVTIGTSGLCEHHPEHNADCGYTEGTAGTPCVHEHTADCYEEVTNCVHEHDEDCYPEESVSGNEATPSGAQKREPENCPHICDEETASMSMTMGAATLLQLRGPPAGMSANCAAVRIVRNWLLRPMQRPSPWRAYRP